MMFEKIFAIDTNIIVDNHQNVLKLADNGKNLIVITKTVLQELDNLKTKGDDFVKYEIRRFQEFINKNLESIEREFEFGTLIKIQNSETVYILLHNGYNIKEYFNNDELIIKTVKQFFEQDARQLLQTEAKTARENMVLVSNDLLFRTIALTEIVLCEPLLCGYYDDKIELEAEYEYENDLPNKEWFSKAEIEKLIKQEITDRMSYIKLRDKETGRETLLQRWDQTQFKVFSETYKSVYGIKFRNLEQKKAFELAINPNVDIVVLEGIAGTSKTLTSLLAALKLMETDHKYKSIKYIRKTVISGSQLDELGFLPGDLEEKMLGYRYPIKDNIEVLIKAKNKKKKFWSKDELRVAIEQFENQNNIEYLYQGHLRGSNLNGIMIIDEAQNFSVQDLRLILSRMQENTKVFIIGSIGQIDNPFLTKENNALTYMLNNCSWDPDLRLGIAGLRLTKVERGKIADWIEHQF